MYYIDQTMECIYTKLKYNEALTIAYWFAFGYKMTQFIQLKRKQLLLLKTQTKFNE